MLINDSTDFLETIRDLLQEQGHTVATTANAATAVEEARHLKPDLILLDLLFQGEQRGWHLLEHIKLTPEIAATPIILCTVAAEALREMDEHLASKHVLVLLKPFDIDDLTTLVQKALLLTDLPASHSPLPSGKMP